MCNGLIQLAQTNVQFLIKMILRIEDYMFNHIFTSNVFVETVIAQVCFLKNCTHLKTMHTTCSCCY